MFMFRFQWPNSYNLYEGAKIPSLITAWQVIVFDKAACMHSEAVLIEQQSSHV